MDSRSPVRTVPMQAAQTLLQSGTHSQKKGLPRLFFRARSIETIALCLTLLTTTRFVFPPSSPTVLFSFLRTAGGRDSTTPACVAWCEARCGARRGGGFKRAVFHNWFFKQALQLSYLYDNTRIDIST